MAATVDLSPPPLQGDHWALADYLELRALTVNDHTFSRTDLQQEFNREFDHSPGGRGPFGESAYEATVASAFEESRRRWSALAKTNYYPFALSDDGEVLRFMESNRNGLNAPYLFMLLATYLNMNEHKLFKVGRRTVDATEFFERFVLEALSSFLNDGRISESESLVFGTSRRMELSQPTVRLQREFEAKVNDLCVRVGDGIGFENKFGGRIAKNDAGLDVVCWKAFPDDKGAALVFLSQCKTGSSWTPADARSFNYEEFQTRWLKRNFEVPPIVCFASTLAADRERWLNCGVGSIMYFDRIRLLARSMFTNPTISLCEKFVSHKVKALKR